MFHIVFNADENYIKYTAVLITSIVKNTDSKRDFKSFCKESNIDSTDSSLDSDSSGGGGGKLISFDSLKENEKSEGYVFHILSDSVSKSTRTKLQNLQKSLSAIYPCEIHIHILSDEEFRGCPKMRGNYLAYFRLKLGSFASKDVSRCLYLDTDMLALGDIREIFAIDLGDKIIGGVADWFFMYNLKMPLRENPQKNDTFNLSGYFNSGMMLVNLEKWREYEVEKKCLEILQKYIPRFADQCTLNTALKDKVLILNQKYNFFNRVNPDTSCKDSPKRGGWFCDYTVAETLESLKNVLIMHYMDTKPWDEINIGSVNEQGCINPLSNRNKYTYKFYKPWWEMVLQTPFFREELLLLKIETSKAALEKYSRLLSEKIKVKDEAIDKRFSEIGENLKNLQDNFKTKQESETALEVKILENQANLEQEKAKNKRLEQEISILKNAMENQKKHFGAKARIHNHLNFKFGIAVLENSKSLLGWLKMPFVLYKVSKKHKQELEAYEGICRINPSLKLPKIQEYSDYQESLKEKESEAYKVGEAFCKAYKKWYKGSLLGFFFWVCNRG